MIEDWECGKVLWVQRKDKTFQHDVECEDVRMRPLQGPSVK